MEKIWRPMLFLLLSPFLLVSFQETPHTWGPPATMFSLGLIQVWIPFSSLCLLLLLKRLWEKNNLNHCEVRSDVLKFYWWRGHDLGIFSYSSQKCLHLNQRQFNSITLSWNRFHSCIVLSYSLRCPGPSPRWCSGTQANKWIKWILWLVWWWK